MALDPVLNFAKVEVSIGYEADDTEIVLEANEGAKLPQPSSDGAFNLVWWNSTDYPDPADDPDKEIVRCTARSTDTLTVTRGQEGISVTTKNTADKIYKMLLGLTKKMMTDLTPTTCLTVMPLSIAPTADASIQNDKQFNSNTTLSLGMVVIPFEITVNKISFSVVTVGTAGTLKIGVYSENGQTQKIDHTTASISSSGIKTETLAAPVALAAGIYYFVILPVGTADLTVRIWSSLSVSYYGNEVANEPTIQGTLTVTASTLPAAFTPSQIVSAAPHTPCLRLDN